DLLVSCGTSASLAAKRHASTLPIVFISVGNPIGIGLVESLARPGGNTTGFSDILADLGGKQVDLATEIQRGRGPINYLWHTGCRWKTQASSSRRSRPIGWFGFSAVGSRPSL